MSPGSEHEPTDAAQQMSAATKRLRDNAWMVAPMTSLVTGETAARAPGDDNDMAGSTSSVEP